MQKVSDTQRNEGQDENETRSLSAEENAAVLVVRTGILLLSCFWTETLFCCWANQCYARFGYPSWTPIIQDNVNSGGII